MATAERQTEQRTEAPASRAQKQRRAAGERIEVRPGLRTESIAFVIFGQMSVSASPKCSGSSWRRGEERRGEERRGEERGI
ncbi:hypothetical protein EYF80_050030 [Liparis tanakae]|uniref:Uncharacterized protein n=1 Tax=Liparis tanakae TaxID=230148 RepID=A0A4Z2FF54_9TELE|nr:hypothetical protein EYF80_050030 [Liparis tanakae]